MAVSEAGTPVAAAVSTSSRAAEEERDEPMKLREFVLGALYWDMSRENIEDFHHTIGLPLRAHATCSGSHLITVLLWVEKIVRTSITS